MRCREHNLAVLHAQLSLAHWPRRALSHTTKYCACSAIDDKSPPGRKARPHANRACVFDPSDDKALVTGATRWRVTQAKKIDVAKYGNLHNHHRWRQSTTVGDRALFSTLYRHKFPLTAATRTVDQPLESHGTALDAWRHQCFATRGCHSEKASKNMCSARNSRKARSASGRATYIGMGGVIGVKKKNEGKKKTVAKGKEKRISLIFRRASSLQKEIDGCLHLVRKMSHAVDVAVHA